MSKLSFLNGNRDGPAPTKTSHYRLPSPQLGAKLSVDHKKSDYDIALPIWNQIDVVCQGEYAVKAAGEEYLPRPNPDDFSLENKKRYEQYLKRAVFYNATGRTLDGLLGLVFRKDPVTEIPSVLEPLRENSDGRHTPLIQQSRLTTSEILKNGRGGLFCDFPFIKDHRSDAVEINPYLTFYPARQIINWRVAELDGKMKLELVVLEEEYERRPESNGDYFLEDKDYRYRVLRLINGIYVVELWQRPDKNTPFTKRTVTPTDGKGLYFDEIPFVFLGSTNNDTIIDDPPLYNLSVLNLAHYRNSADYEDSCFFVGQVQPWISGLNEEWRDNLEESGIYIGSRTPILLPEKGQFGFAQASENSLVGEAMEKKENLMIALGARLLQPSSQIKTATEAQADSEEESSVLSSVALNVSNGYTQALGWAYRFKTGEKEDSDTVKMQLFRSFFEYSVDSNMLSALVKSWQAGLLPTSQAWRWMRERGLIDASDKDEALKDELESADLYGIEDALAIGAKMEGGQNENENEGDSVG
ncbi:MAG: DUF4055 domain-containing protein [Candidatus Thiodiazotropha endolucinida]|nr:DUF4055 domain-containing protein [Candidatus Thiodiazotropha taylori]MCW4321588.1 DUF4055 domain-containing protein [Candidatus Thiodiazotropha taylori]